MVNGASSLYNRFLNNSGQQRGGGITDFKGEMFFKLLQSKKKFLAMIFANLIFQLAITYVAMEKFESIKKQEHFYAVIIANFALIIALVAIPMPIYVKIIVFSLFSTLTGYTLSFLRERTDPAIIKTAILSTMSIFASMFIFGAFLLSIGIQLGFWFGLGLLVALLCIIIFNIVAFFLGTYSVYSKIMAVISLVIFSLFIVYDTNTILQRNYYGDFVTASLDYYLDIINIFLDIVTIHDS